ncbi:LytR C-terminal domain-containing protein [Janthinobacterium fluminis]|uniref:Tetratricopeptide repeat protein n=1 Tax=Janthinobacterium fluminis TaxID=2987524 RepID=A0ABT5K664_9BURK|nr:LytR C-terminal domain-containing protein [Janthinobacterium fluminis]MDC8760490.1 tetratricopeptide repeat protein [Janthinobacterium fluminis]
MHTTLRRRGIAAACLLLGGCALGGGGGGAPPVTAAPAALQSADSHYVLGRNHHAAGRDADALQAYRQALQIAPGHGNARNGLAVLAAGRGDYAAAIALWQGLTGDGAAAPQSAHLYANLGYAHHLSGDNQRALAALEQACVLDPLNALSWEHLGAVLEQLGQTERAALMLRQARSLRRHDPRADYALARQGVAAPAAAPPAAPTPAPDGAGAWAPPLARTELVAAADGMLELRRVAQAAAPAAVATVTAPAPASGSAALVAQAAPLRLEIRNGNGVPGMAAALGRTLASAQLRVIRVSNERHFLVAHSRVEYRPELETAARALAGSLGPLVRLEAAPCAPADLRVVLGRDQLDPVALHRYYVKQLKLARLELAKFG